MAQGLLEKLLEPLPGLLPAVMAGSTAAGGLQPIVHATIVRGGQSMLRPFLPFRAKPLKRPVQPKAYVIDQRTDPNVNEILVSIKASRRSIRVARPAVTKRLRILGRNGAEG